jgi:hypothetical protein
MHEPQKFRKKPVVIEAMQMAGTNTEMFAVYSWVESQVGSFDVNSPNDPIPNQGVSIDAADGMMVIATLEGLMKVSIGDWVIKGIEGEFYPCKPGIFNDSYEKEG